MGCTDRQAGPRPRWASWSSQGGCAGRRQGLGSFPCKGPVPGPCLPGLWMECVLRQMQQQLLVLQRLDIVVLLSGSPSPPLSPLLCQTNFSPFKSQLRGSSRKASLSLHASSPAGSGTPCLPRGFCASCVTARITLECRSLFTCSSARQLVGCMRAGCVQEQPNVSPVPGT